VLIARLITTGDTGEFVVRPLGDRGIGLSQELLPRLSASLAPAAAAAGNTLSFVSYQTVLAGGFRYFHPESIKKSELRDLKREF
jgi:hypothetical protein